MLKLHLGCGKNYFEGWVNIDNNTYGNLKKLDLNYDIRKGLPYSDKSVSFIYSQHFIEHFSLQEGYNLLKECKRVLKPEGVLRIATPDLDRIMRVYNDPNWRQYIKGDRLLEDVRTIGEYMNRTFRAWGHQYLYNGEDLSIVLERAGFTNLEFCNFCQSRHTELANLETAKNATLIVEAMPQREINKNQEEKDWER